MASDHPTNEYVWYVIALLFVVNVFNYMDRMALSVLLPFIKEDLHVSDAQLGLLIGFSFSLFYGICGIPIAVWADRGVRRDIIATALTVWSVMTALSGAAQNFWHLFVARVGVGAGEAGCLPPAQSIICDYVPVNRRAGVFAIHSFGLFVGMVMGMALAGWLGESIGWRWTFVVLGVPGIGLALIVRMTLREPTRGASDAKSQDPVLAFSGVIAVLWHSRTYKLLLIFMVTTGFVQFGSNQWWPSFYARVHGLSMSSIGASLGLAIGIGSGIGLLIGGWVANKVARRDVSLPLRIGSVAILASIPAAAGSLLIQSSLLSMVLVSTTGLLWSIPSGSVVAAMYSVVRSNMRATAGSISIFFTSVIGFGAGPFCVGVLTDWLTPTFGAQSLRYSLLAPLSLCPVMIIALWLAAKSMRSDLQAVDVQSGSIRPRFESARSYWLTSKETRGTRDGY